MHCIEHAGNESLSLPSLFSAQAHLEHMVKIMRWATKTECRYDYLSVASAI